MKSTAADQDKSSNGRRLDELAGLLAVAISRANTRRMAAQSGESSTGLLPPNERVSVSESGQ
jgi:hypothetical protein